MFAAELDVSVWCNQVEHSSYSTKSPKSNLSKKVLQCSSIAITAVFSGHVESKIPFGGSLVKFPSNQDSGFHKIIPVRTR